VSVCIATRRTGPPLLACLDSLAAQVGGPPFEVLVCADGAEVADDVRSRLADARFAFVADDGGAPVSPADKRNSLVARAEGEWLLFLDDDVIADPHLLRRLGEVAAAYPAAGALGGPNLTPPGSTEFQQVQGAVLGSFIGAGPVRRKWGAHPAVEADERFFTLCNLAIRRSLMLQFPPGHDAGEENAVLNELHRRGVTMRYDPALVVSHERRATLGQFARQIRKFDTIAPISVPSIYFQRSYWPTSRCSLR
jgi:GT2 family glycosyltransferase